MPAIQRSGYANTKQPAPWQAEYNLNKVHDRTVKLTTTWIGLGSSAKRVTIPAMANTSILNKCTAVFYHRCLKDKNMSMLTYAHIATMAILAYDWP